MEQKILNWWMNLKDKARFLIIENAYWEFTINEEKALYDKVGEKLNWGVIGFIIGSCFAVWVLISIKGVL